MKTDHHVQTDEELVLQVQNGSHDAFAELVRRYSTYLYRVVWRTYPDKSEAEDIVQDVFLKFWDAPQKFDSERGVRFKTWISRVAVNRAIDASRKKKPVPDYEYLLQQKLEDEDIPLHDLERSVKKMELEAAIQSLPERQKLALDLCFYEEMKHKEAAEIMDVSVKGVEALLVRAKQTLRRILGERQEDAA